MRGFFDVADFNPSPSDATPAFEAAAQAAAAEGGIIWVPPGEHRVSELALPSYVALRCAGPGVMIRGVDPDVPILRFAAGETRGVIVEGGRWADCSSVVAQSGAISVCRFRDMSVLGDVTAAIELTRSVVGCEFSGLNIDGGPQKAVIDGVLIDVLPPNVVATNHWSGCRIAHLAGGGLRMTGSHGAKTVNAIRDLWIEDVDGHGVEVGNGVDLLSVRDSYLAYCGGYDVLVRHTMGGRPRGVVIETTQFANAGDAPDQRRIRVEGLSQIKVRDSKFRLQDPGQRCVSAGLGAEEIIAEDCIISLSQGSEDYTKLLLEIDQGATPVAHVRSRYQSAAEGVTGATGQ